MVKDVVNKVGDALAGAVRKALHVAAGDTTPAAPAAAPAAPPSSDVERQMKVAERVMELDRNLLRELAKR